MSLSKIAQLVIGVIVGILIVSGVITGAGYWYFSQYAKSPAKPTFTNDNEAPKAPAFDPYLAEVTYNNGLFLREEPSKESKTLKVLYFRQKLTVLDSPKDKQFDKVRVEFDDETVLEGWVSAGNIQRIDEETEN